MILTRDFQLLSGARPQALLAELGRWQRLKTHALRRHGPDEGGRLAITFGMQLSRATLEMAEIECSVRMTSGQLRLQTTRQDKRLHLFQPAWLTTCGTEQSPSRPQALGLQQKLRHEPCACKNLHNCSVNLRVFHMSKWQA